MLEISAATRRVARHVVVGSDGARRYLSPDFTLPDSTDQPFTLSSLRGKVALVDISAVW